GPVVLALHHQRTRLGPVLADQAADFGGAAAPVLALADAVRQHVAPEVVGFGIEGAAPGNGAGRQTQLALDQRNALESGQADDAAVVEHQRLRGWCGSSVHGEVRVAVPSKAGNW